jgi:hypothetical protein
MAYQRGDRKSRVLQTKAALRGRMSNKRINAIMRASSRPTPRKQPTAGQLIGAGIIKGN